MHPVIFVFPADSDIQKVPNVSIQCLEMGYTT